MTCLLLAAALTVAAGFIAWGLADALHNAELGEDRGEHA